MVRTVILLIFSNIFMTYAWYGHLKNTAVPLWKAIQSNIKSISIDKINLDGVKLLYRNADTSESVKLQFDRCEALFKNVRIDSAATAIPAGLVLHGN